MTDREIDDLWLEAFKASSDDGKVRQRFAELCYQRGAAEADNLRADAERYRWMKREVKRIPPAWGLCGWDAAIDAAMN